MPEKFVKKRFEVFAYQLPPADCDQEEVEKLHAWSEEVGFHNWVSDRDCTIVITTLEGDMTAHPGDWIVGPGAEGEFWPVKESIFAATYLRAEEDELIERRMKADEFVEKITGWIIDAQSKLYPDAGLAEAARAKSGLTGVYTGKSQRLHRLVRLAYLRGIRRGAYSVWESKQKVYLRSGDGDGPQASGA